MILQSCDSCAKEAGATWKGDALTSWWRSTCHICGKDKGVANASSWNWPKEDQPANE